MNVHKFPPKLLFGILLAIVFGIAVYIRVGLPYDQVFSGDWIKFTSSDAYYHMRIVDNLVHNFPHLTHFDPYFKYPGLGWLGSIHFFDWLLAGIIWVIGLGSPTQHTVDVIGVYFPAILGALTVIPVYFIGKALFNRWAGVLAALLITILPSEYLGRSMLGFTDHHVAETLFSATAVLFLILAIKEGVQRRLTFSHLMKRDQPVITKPLIYSLLAGIFLGIYLITWEGGLLFVFILSLYLIVQFIIDHLRRESSDHLGIIGAVMFLVALIIFLPFSPATDFSAAIVIALFIPLVLAFTSRLISRQGLKTFYYPLTLVGLGIVLIAIFYIIAPGTLGAMLTKFSIFNPAGATATATSEMQPFLSSQGGFSTLAAWDNFTTSFFIAPWWLIPGFGFAALCGLIYRYGKKGSGDKPLLLALGLCVVIMIIATWVQFPSAYNLGLSPIPGFAIISFIILIWLFMKQRSDEKHHLLFFVWTLVILIATLVQRRFAYYLVVNVALLSAYLSWQAIWLAGLRRLATKPVTMPEGIGTKSAKTKVKKRHRGSQGITIYHMNVVLAIIVVFLFVFFPSIVKAREVASAARFAPTDAWQASLLWMKENTPEPFGDPDKYYEFYERATLPRPKPSYGVMAWWDYGYWVIRIAHRVPNTNPGQPPVLTTDVARFFLSQDEKSANTIRHGLSSSYVIIDYRTVTDKFWAIVTWSGQEPKDFFDVYYLPRKGELVPVQLFHPQYYRSLSVRLYNFDGKAVTPKNSLVISYREGLDKEGRPIKEITSSKSFSSYEQAVTYISEQKSANYEIVGTDPFVSPVPLEAVELYKLTYSSESTTVQPSVSVIPVPSVKIFQYVGVD